MQEEQEKDIIITTLTHQLKKQLRLAMNGIVSSDMRNKGLNYKLNYGITVPQLKKIAEQFPKNDELADYCWKSSAREMKILSALLQPIDSFTSKMAEERVNNMPTIEIAQLYCINLFQFLPFAEEKSIEWLQKDDMFIRTIGYLLLTRLFLKQQPVEEKSADLFLDSVKKDLCSSSFGLKKAAVDCLKSFGRMNLFLEKGLDIILPFKDSVIPQEKELYDDIRFDWDFHSEKQQ